MTNTEELELRIKESGLKKSFIAMKLGISLYTLKKKINNEVQFKAQEITELCKILSINSTKDKIHIFLTEK